MQIKVFPSWIAFTAWKEEEEKSTYSFFIQPKGAVESMTTSDMGKLLNSLFMHTSMSTISIRCSSTYSNIHLLQGWQQEGACGVQ